MKKIEKISRQRRWQLKKLKEGKCIICGKKAVTKKHCEFHRKTSNENKRSRHKKKLDKLNKDEKHT